MTDDYDFTSAGGNYFQHGRGPKPLNLPAIDWKARAEAAEAELARLRAPVEVGDVVKRLGIYARDEDGWVSVDEAIAETCRDAADLLQRLAVRVWELEADVEAATEIKEVCRKDAETAEARLREAVELLTDAREKGLIYWAPQTTTGYVKKAEMLKTIDAFLATLEDHSNGK